jgi:hypothetical protein
MTSVLVASGRCQQCGEKLQSVGSFRLEDFALRAGKVISLLGCAVSFLGLLCALVWLLLYVCAKDMRIDFGSIIINPVVIVLSTVISFLYSLAMWVVFTHVLKTNNYAFYATCGKRTD